MRAFRSLVLLAVLAGCAAPGPRAVAPARAPRAAATAPPAPPTTPTPAGTPKPSGTPAAAIAPVATLRKPAAGTRTLAGRIVIDAGYAVARGAAIVSNNGGGAIAVGGARADGAGGILSNNGAAIALAAGGNVVAPAGAGSAGELAGGRLLAAGATGAKAGYRLGQAAPLTAGAQLAAAGMLVSVVSLRDRSYVPIGEDAAGEAVYAVYSDAEGRYAVHVPASAGGNLLVVACPPEAEPGLAYNVVEAGAGADGVTVDEIGASFTDFTRRAAVGSMYGVLADPELSLALIQADPNYTPTARAAIEGAHARITALAQETGLAPETDPALLEAIARRAIDATLATMDLAAVRIDADAVKNWPYPPKPVVTAFRTRLTELVEGASGRLAEDPAYFSMAFLRDVINAPGDTGYHTELRGSYDVRKGADVATFMLDEYFTIVNPMERFATERIFRAVFGSEHPRDVDPYIATRVDEATQDVRSGSTAMTVFACRRIMEDEALRARIRTIFASR